MPKDSILCPIVPLSIRETIKILYLSRLIAESSLSNIISAPPVFKPVIKWTIFFFNKNPLMIMNKDRNTVKCREGSLYDYELSFLNK